MQSDEFFKLVRKRRCIRRFKPDPVPDEYVEKVIEAARWAQSGANAQPWEFIVVKNKETKDKIVDFYVDHLKQAWDKDDEDAIAYDNQMGASDLIFSKYDGKPLLPDSITHAWRTIAKRSGLSGVRLHDARHTHASLMLKQGIHPKIVQERLGHASIQITLDTYSHVAAGLQEAAATRFDDILLPNRETESIR